MQGVNDDRTGHDRAARGDAPGGDVPGGDAAGGTDAGDRGTVTEGVDHLQAAALELIDAARAFLDVVEELVGDRDRLAEVAETVSTMAGLAARAVARTRPGPTPDGSSAPGADGTRTASPGAPEGGSGATEGEPSRVQRITVT